MILIFSHFSIGIVVKLMISPQKFTYVFINFDKNTAKFK